jgi:hypothetical protein
VGRDGNGLVLPTITPIIVQLAVTGTWKVATDSIVVRWNFMLNRVIKLVV